MPVEQRVRAGVASTTASTRVAEEAPPRTKKGAATAARGRHSRIVLLFIAIALGASIIGAIMMTRTSDRGTVASSTMDIDNLEDQIKAMEAEIEGLQRHEPGGASTTTAAAATTATTTNLKLLGLKECYRELCCNPPHRQLDIAHAEVVEDLKGNAPSLVVTHKGNAPILITAGHGGNTGKWQKKKLSVRKQIKQNVAPAAGESAAGFAAFDVSNDDDDDDNDDAAANDAAEQSTQSSVQAAAQTFRGVRDGNTNDIALELAAVLPIVRKECGRNANAHRQNATRAHAAKTKEAEALRAYFVMAKFHRSYVDVNRPLNDSAYCCEKGGTSCTAVRIDRGKRTVEARRIYNRFHDAIGSAVGESARRWPTQRVLHIDIHAQGNRLNIPELGIHVRDGKNTIFIGTSRGTSVKDKAALWSATGFVGLLRAQLHRRGYASAKIRPRNAREPEHPRYPGGYITTTWGHALTGVSDVLQLEFGFMMRKKRRRTVVRALAGALACHAALHGDPKFGDENCKAECLSTAKLAAGADDVGDDGFGAFA